MNIDEDTARMLVEQMQNAHPSRTVLVVDRDHASARDAFMSFVGHVEPLLPPFAWLVTDMIHLKVRIHFPDDSKDDIKVLRFEYVHELPKRLRSMSLSTWNMSSATLLTVPFDEVHDLERALEMACR